MHSKNWILVTIFLIIIVFSVIYYFEPKSDSFCIQILTEAKNRFTGEIKTFSNPCGFSKLFWKAL